MIQAKFLQNGRVAPGWMRAFGSCWSLRLSWSCLVQVEFNIQHSTFNIQHSTFNIQHSTFNIQHSTFNIQHLTLKRSDFTSPSSFFGSVYLRRTVLVAGHLPIARRIRPLIFEQCNKSLPDPIPVTSLHPCKLPKGYLRRVNFHRLRFCQAPQASTQEKLQILRSKNQID